MNHKILIVDDEPAIREMLEFALRHAGYSTAQAGDVTRAQQQLTDWRPDLMLLDWMLPGASGLELARRLKRTPDTQKLPIIMLTARGEEEDKIRGLETGADDYVTKPFSPRELIARIQAVLRRSQPTDPGDVLKVDGLMLDPVGVRVSSRGAAVEMGPTEFRLLQFFMAHPERVFSRGQLLDNVWGTQACLEERTVDVHIRRLRKALAPHGHEGLIQTVRGSGYRFSSRT